MTTQRLWHGQWSRSRFFFFLEFSWFLCNPRNVGNLTSGSSAFSFFFFSSAFSKFSLNSWKFSIHVLLKPHLENFEHYFLACEVSAIVWQFEHSLALPFFMIGMKTDLFQSMASAEFPNYWHIECISLTASSFRIWDNSAGTPSPPLALFIVMLHKAHLTSHSRMSGSKWVITPSWLSGSIRSFFV